ncbi:hypothetical protein OX423_001755 [Salmonella enterica]|nr:hypothetical protein [Salmonella enterica]EHK1113207.1 hypothetical protein [Salmonella enterica subsp. enterica serovar Minnesota]EIF7244509.1 hypothetical protein [Salmonella enterica subsp. enterica serovar Minnesota]EIF9014693.1 hypothetical protein [Salmonella enterica]EIS8673190.1 hypothetical protein [Salmonella enterica subsp. enterica serovar Minnesota]
MGSNIIELAKLGHERAAELKASCGAVDVRSLAQLISDLSTQLEVQHVRSTELAVQLANAESKCRELAAENSTIKVMNDCLSEELRGYESDGAFEGPKMHLLWWKVETPATDAFLSEVRVQGVEMYADTLDHGADDAERDGFEDGMKFLRAEADGVRKFAAQLRQGAEL